MSGASILYIEIDQRLFAVILTHAVIITAVFGRLYIAALISETKINF